MKNSTKKLCIKIEDLPPRPQIITPEEYEKIFGGKCHPEGGSCSGVMCKYCCSGLACAGETVARDGICVNW
jgi:hypothetical protein